MWAAMIRILVAALGIVALGAAVRIVTRQPRDYSLYGSRPAFWFHTAVVSVFGAILIVCSVLEVRWGAIGFVIIGLGVADGVVGLVARRRSRTVSSRP